MTNIPIFYHKGIRPGNFEREPPPSRVVINEGRFSSASPEILYNDTLYPHFHRAHLLNDSTLVSLDLKAAVVGEVASYLIHSGDRFHEMSSDELLKSIRAIPLSSELVVDNAAQEQVHLLKQLLGREISDRLMRTQDFFSELAPDFRLNIPLRLGGPIGKDQPLQGAFAIEINPLAIIVEIEYQDYLYVVGRAGSTTSGIAGQITYDPQYRDQNHIFIRRTNQEGAIISSSSIGTIRAHELLHALYDVIACHENSIAFHEGLARVHAMEDFPQPESLQEITEGLYNYFMSRVWTECISYLTERSEKSPLPLIPSYYKGDMLGSGLKDFKQAICIKSWNVTQKDLVYKEFEKMYSKFLSDSREAQLIVDWALDCSKVDFPHDPHRLTGLLLCTDFKERETLIDYFGGDRVVLIKQINQRIASTGQKFSDAISKMEEQIKLVGGPASPEWIAENQINELSELQEGLYPIQALPGLLLALRISRSYDYASYLLECIERIVDLNRGDLGDKYFEQTVSGLEHFKFTNNDILAFQSLCDRVSKLIRRIKGQDNYFSDPPPEIRACQILQSGNRTVESLKGLVVLLPNDVWGSEIYFRIDFALFDSIVETADIALICAYLKKCPFSFFAETLLNGLENHLENNVLNSDMASNIKPALHRALDKSWNEDCIDHEYYEKLSLKAKKIQESVFSQLSEYRELF